MSARAQTPLLKVLLVAAWLAVPAVANAEPNTFTTFAGNGANTFAGDGGPAPQASFNWPYGMGWLGDGSMLVADVNNNRVRRISTTGVISTVVGTGAAGSSGDGGPATNATLNAPQGLAVAPDGATYYISERGGSRIRRVNSSGTIATIVGALGAGFAGDGGPAGSARINAAEGLSVAPGGDLYVADRSNHRIRRITHGGDGTVTSAGTITTVAGNGTAGFSGDGGAATGAAFNQPLGVLAEAGGAFVISDFANNRIRRVDSGGIVTTIAGTATQCPATTGLCGDGGLATGANLNRPADIKSDGTGGYIFADYSDNRVRQITAAGVIQTLVGTGYGCTATANCGDGGRAEVASTTLPTGILLGPGGRLYVSGVGHRIRVRTPVASVAGPSGPAGGQGPAGPAGAAGTAGPQGAAGAAGDQGATGAAGGQGAAGAAGGQGSAGTPGISGVTGAPGAAGATGAAGAQGSAGPTGTEGSTGQSGRDGDVGADGREGSAGRDGVDGSRGEDGLPGMFFGMWVLLPSERIVSRPARHTYVRLFVSGPSRVTVRLARGSDRVSITRRFKRIGRKRFDFGRLGRGRYAVSVTARSTVATGSSRAAHDATRLVIR